MKKGKVYIIGAGPGDPGLITVKALQLIKTSQVIVYDRLVGTCILNHAAENAELINVGKEPDRHPVPQEEINRILVLKALEGKTVARVKGGDPFLFGRGGEEAEELSKNGIEFIVVPGVTSAVAVPAYAGIPVTHRDKCSSLHIITGHEKPDKEQSSIDYETLARLRGTLVFLMGIKNLGEITKNLMEYGKDKLTPAAVIENGTTGKQRSVTGTLDDICEKVQAHAIKSPAVTIIGDVVSLGDTLNWFKKGALQGKKILVTRPKEQAEELLKRITELGGEPIALPVIKISPLKDYSDLDLAIDKITEYNWLVFTSVNGVKAFFERLKIKETDIRSLNGIELCAVGKATAEELESRGLMVSCIPERFTTSDLLEELLKRVKKEDKVLLARADIAGEDLSKGLYEAGIHYTDVAVYRTENLSYLQNEIIRVLAQEPDFITFTSPSTVKGFGELIGDGIKDLKAKVVCIGPVTEKAAREAGFKVLGAAGEYTIEGLINKLCELSED